MKDLTVMRSDLRLDLKDSDALWSDAELNRCIEIAHADFSRFNPREKIYEEVLNFSITGESVTFPKDTDVDYIVDGQTLNLKVAGDTFTIAAQPDVPRVLTLLLTDADDSITDWNIRVYGTDDEDLGVAEDFYFGNGKSQTGKQLFKRVHKVELVSVSGTAAAGDTLDIGIGAYTDSWVPLANRPIKQGSDTATDDTDAAVVQGVDYIIDYIQGKVKAIASADIAAEEVCTFAYTKDQTTIDLGNLADFIRAYRVEYPVGRMPQQFCQYDVFAGQLVITGMGEYSEQENLSEGYHVRISYQALHHSPTDYTPGTVPEFLEETVEKAASAYALFMYALKSAHNAQANITLAAAAVADGNTAQTAIGTALTNLTKYLNDNGAVDAVGILATIDFTYLGTALGHILTYLADAVGAGGSISLADGVRANYATTVNYIDGGTEPDVKTYLISGDALINSITEGGENERTPEMYAAYATAVKNSLIGAWENDRQMYLQDATVQVNAALAAVQEASQWASKQRIILDQSTGYQNISALFAREAEDRIAQIEEYTREAAQYIQTAAGDLAISERFRTEAVERLAEVQSIWRDRTQYIGDYTMSSAHQMQP